MKARSVLATALVAAQALTVGVVAGAGLVATATPAGADVDAQTAVVDERPRDGGVSAVDGEMHSLAQVGDKVVFGGTFTKVGPGMAGAAGMVDVAGKAFRPGFPEVAGTVLAALPDGTGGWYLAGSFDRVGSTPRSNAAHVDAAGAVTDWNPAPNAAVHALVAHADGIVLGGAFTALGSAPAGRLARVDRSTGAVSWTGAVNGTVRALDLSPDSTRLYVGGDFVKAGNTAVKRLVAVDSATGALDPTFGFPAVNLAVRAIESRGAQVWIGGDFVSVDGAPRGRLAMLDAATGALSDVNPNANGAVLDLELAPDGSTLYAAGRFTTVSGTARSRVAALDATSGALGSLSVGGLSGEVSALALDGSGGLYLGGAFVVQPERSAPARLARVTLASGQVAAVVPPAALPQALSRRPVSGAFSISSLALQDGALLVAGDFADYGIVDRARLGAYDLATGALDRGFDPAPDGPVDTVKASSDGRAVFVGGAFTTIAGGPARNLAKLDVATGTPVPGFSASADAYVKDMAVSPDGSWLYVGGGFGTVNNAPAGKLAALDAGTGALRSDFDFPLDGVTNPTSDGGTRALALTPDGRTLMVIGNFRTVAGQDRPLVGQIDVGATPAALTGWRTTVYDQPCSRGYTGWMRDVDIAPDGATAYIVTSGHFYYPACDTVNAFPMSSASSDVAPTWTTRIGDTLESVAATGSAIYISGHFRYLDTETQTQNRFHIGALDPATGAGLNWKPNADGFRGVLTLEAEPAGLLLGGDGDLVGGVPHGRMALFPTKVGLDVRKLPDVPWLPAPGGTVTYTITVTNATAGALTLTSLADERLGDLAGRGTCALPQTLAAATSYRCTVSESVTGDAGAEITAGTTARTTDGSKTFSDTDRSTVELLGSSPTLRLRAIGGPASIVFPQSDARFGLTAMNLDQKRPLTLTGVTSPQYGDLASACGLPRTVAPNSMVWCRLTKPVSGAIGSRPTYSFSATATVGSTSVSSSASTTFFIVPPPSGTTAVQVVGDPAALAAADVKVRDRLARTYTVRLADDDTVTAADLADASVAVVGSSVWDPKLGDRLVSAATPVVAVRPGAADELGLAGATADDQGRVDALGYDIAAPRHPLAAGYAGTVPLYGSVQPVSWTRPAPAATVVAGLDAERATVYAYAPGATLANGTPAPACRVGLPAINVAVSRWNAAGWALFDRAVAYAAADCGRGILYTVAGSGALTHAGDGVQSTGTGMNQPWDVVVDAQNALYYTDHYNHAVRKISPAGIVTTVAGTGTAGAAGDGGPATSAQLNYPSRLALDSAGNLYISDTNNNKIRKVSASGVITTVAGSGAAGYGGDGGPATSAYLRTPFDVDVDAAGTLYIADRGNNRIRKVSTTGIITTIAGNGQVGYAGDGGPATSARLRTPLGVVADTRGNVYIADYDNERVRMVDTAGRIRTVAGTGSPTADGDGGPATSAGLHKPQHVMIGPDGDLFISESNNNRLRRVDVDGTISTFAGTGGFGYTGDGGPPTLSTWQRPSAAAFGPDGVLYVVDRGNRRIRAIAPG